MNEFYLKLSKDRSNYVKIFSVLFNIIWYWIIVIGCLKSYDHIQPTGQPKIQYRVNYDENIL